MCLWCTGSGDVYILCFFSNPVFARDMLKYTVSVRDWMSEDSRNVIAIHCKGGKGKTVYIFDSIVVIISKTVYIFV